MADGMVAISSMSGPAAIAATFANLERHVRIIVGIAIEKQAIHGDVAAGIGDMHDRVAHLFDEVTRDYGTDTMVAAAEYAAAALEAGLIYPGDEVEHFVRAVARSVRATTRALAKTGGGSVAE